MIGHQREFLSILTARNTLKAEKESLNDKYKILEMNFRSLQRSKHPLEREADFEHAGKKRKAQILDVCKRLLLISRCRDWRRQSRKLPAASVYTWSTWMCAPPRMRPLESSLYPQSLLMSTVPRSNSPQICHQPSSFMQSRPTNSLLKSRTLGCWPKKTTIFPTTSWLS